MCCHSKLLDSDKTPYSAYMLASAALGPLYGKLSDILGEFHAACMFHCSGIDGWDPQAGSPCYMDPSSYF